MSQNEFFRGNFSISGKAKSHKDSSQASKEGVLFLIIGLTLITIFQKPLEKVLIDPLALRQKLLEDDYLHIEIINQNAFHFRLVHSCFLGLGKVEECNFML